MKKIIAVLTCAALLSLHIPLTAADEAAKSLDVKVKRSADDKVEVQVIGSQVGTFVRCKDLKKNDKGEVTHVEINMMVISTNHMDAFWVGMLDLKSLEVRGAMLTVSKHGEKEFTDSLEHAYVLENGPELAKEQKEIKGTLTWDVKENVFRIHESSVGLLQVTRTWKRIKEGKGEEKQEEEGSEGK